MRAWIAVLTAVALTSGGAFAHAQPRESEPPPAVAPEGTALTGTFDEGLRLGEQQARESPVGGAFTLGFATLFILPVCAVGTTLVMVTAAGVCVPNGPIDSSKSSESEKAEEPKEPEERDLPADWRERTPEFLKGYDTAYEEIFYRRQKNAVAGGFWTAVAIVGASVLYYRSLEPNERRDLSRRGEFATSGSASTGPHGAVLVEF